MKSFKILTLAATLATTGLLMSTAVNAGTYSTTVSIDDLSTILTWEETTPMQFPTLLLDKKSSVNDSCDSNSSDASVNELCQTSRDGATNAIFTVSGTANGNFGIQLDQTPDIVEGIKFIPFDVGGSLVLNENGTANHQIGGFLQLLDRDTVTSTNLTFTYNLEFVGQ